MAEEGLVSQESSETWLDIPDAVWEPKPEFAETPSVELIREIRTHIRDTGEPWTWRGHTHTKPPRGSHIYYAGEFDLPDKYTQAGHFSPCPCCSPNNRKFGSGKIAWFPDEKVIRLIGPSCFKSLDAHIHAEAVADYEIRKQQTRDRDFILDRLDLIPGWLSDCENLVDIARGTDEFFPKLSNALDAIARGRFFENIRGGEMKVWENIREPYVDKDGSLKSRSKSMQVHYGTIDGHDGLAPNRSSYVKVIEEAKAKLRSLGAFSPEYVSGCAHPVKADIANQIAKAIKTLKRARDKVGAEVRFLRRENTNRLRNWGCHQGAPFRFDLAVDKGVMTVSAAAGVYSIPIPEAVRGVMMPKFGGL
ncbi:hypothetical protein [Agrobacterium sp. LAD9]|uniref:hypothetical protein n=1 Tax=Agrobacterium sp. LAD9 TaxID=2055153 RepID=UPI0012906640|nr:hypothetical protein [Agrobacterium sp. LAD9]